MSLRDSHPLQAAHRGTPAAVSRSRVTLVTELADRLRSERASAGLSQTTLAGEAFSPSYISLIESGRRTPTEGALPVLAARLGTTPEYLRHGDKAPSDELGGSVLEQVEGHGIAGTDEHLRLASTILWSYYERGDLLFATHRAAELINLADSKGTMRGRGSIYWNASLVAEGRGDLAEARRLAERALAYQSEGAASRDVPRLRLHYAWLLLRSDPAEPRLALEHLEPATRELELIGSEIDLARCEFESGRAHLILGDARRAEDLARAGLARLDQHAALDVCNGRMLLGDALVAQGTFEEAKESYRWAADMFGMMTAGRESATVWRSLGDRMLQQGDHEGAAKAYEAALREAGIRPTVLPMVASFVEAAGFSRREDADRS